MNNKEARFEADIEAALLKSGYQKGNQKTYDCERAIDMPKLITYIKKTQPRQWQRFAKIYGRNAEDQLYKQFQKAVAENGLLHVLRKGFKDRQILFRVCSFKPNNRISEKAKKKYKANIFTETRQFRYSTKNRNTIDMVLSLNGIPIIAIELKNPETGQNVEHAKKQWMYDRDQNEFCFHRDNRFLVYFAVDTYSVAMTTELNGANTRFLPFNQGSNGAGKVGGAGNPENPKGYPTSYLWEKVVSKDSLMLILKKYMLHERKNTSDISITRDRMLFPRYHQLDVTSMLVKDVKKNGAGKNYLIQHSAGSGKSNSIAWLAYGLANLFDKDDEPIFRSVIVVSDRRVLNAQLQETIDQFNHKKGVVVNIGRNKTAKDLRDAINSGSRIIVTTLQKFPVIFDQVEGTEGENYAVIVDEAHSSQTGTCAKKLKAALADKGASLREYAEMEAKTEAEIKDEEDIIVDQMLAHGKHKNLSFFAFTATPKRETLETFGVKDKDGHYKPFHVYSMRQAIEEGFILDALDHYMTYQDCYRLVNETSDNPEVFVLKVVKEIKQYESLNPDVISQKASIIVEIFREKTAPKINGHAKAMVVTSSRLHAVRYYQEIQKYIKKNKYKDIGVLVAFSESVQADGKEYTEAGMNIRKDGTHIRESELPKEFATDKYKILVVAEKYQTGFDEPLLHTMFVDKQLKGVKAVQTLSRLNRTYPGKTDTLVIDFANTAEDIKEAFQPYYEETILDHAIDVNLIYETQKELRKYNVYGDNDVQQYIQLYTKTEEAQSDTDLGISYSILLRAVNKYRELSRDDQFLFKKTIRNFCKWYSYITMITRIFDRDLEEEYVYCQKLEKMLPNINEMNVDIIDKLSMDKFQIKKTFEGGISLKESLLDNELSNPNKIDTRVQENLTEQLNDIIEEINERFGDLSEANKDVICSIYKEALNDKTLKKNTKVEDPSFFKKNLFLTFFRKEIAKNKEANPGSTDIFFKKQGIFTFTQDLIGEKVFSHITHDVLPHSGV